MAQTDKNTSVHSEADRQTLLVHADALHQAQEVSQGGSAEGLLGTMVSMLKTRDGALQEREEEQFVPLIRQMAEQAELAVRRKLAEQIANLPNAPRGLLEFLAHDEIEVAEPVLSQSVLFDDDLLIEVIEDKGPEHATAIAGRPNVSKSVSSAIIETGATDAILALLENDGSEIQNSDFGKIAGWASGNNQMQQALVNRNELPEMIAQQIFWSTRGGLRQQILERFSIRPGQLDILLKEAVSDGLADPEIVGLRDAIDQAIGGKPANRWVPVSELIGHIKAGRLGDFASGVSRYLSIRKKSVERILIDEGGEALAVLCRALDADRTQFTSVLLKNDYRRFGTPRPPGQIEQVARIYDSIAPDGALATVKMWDVMQDQLAA